VAQGGDVVDGGRPIDHIRFRARAAAAVTCRRNPTDYAYHLTRRARGLPLWFSLAVHGVRAYTEAIEAAISLARLTADEIAARDYLELIREPGLGVVLFRRQGWAPAQYSDWADRLLHDQVAFIPRRPPAVGGALAVERAPQGGAGLPGSSPAGRAV
jgi:Pyridoxal-dependent decarboxylase conserved domain